MRTRFWLGLTACATLACPPASLAQAPDFAFGVIAQASMPNANEATIREAILEADADNLAFVVASGIKASDEPCTDDLYKQRKELFDSAKNGMVVSIAGSDWTECKNARGKPAAAERLNRLREYFFSDEFSFGASRIPLVRQSRMAKFHSYAENTRWEIGDIMFATINLPINNNHYLPEAGRNSEFEDRMVANRDWLQRIFTFAASRKSSGIVLFCDGDPLAKTEPAILFYLGSKRDGFAEIRQQITQLAVRFAGKVLLVHNRDAAENAGSSKRISWRKNIGEISAPGSGWLKLTVGSDLALFGVGIDAPALQATRRKQVSQPEHADQ